jgi:TatA/E family protein of Tat protein translocase
MFDIGFPELVLILVIALLVFGPGKMAEIGRELGKGVREFRKATTDLQKEFTEAMQVETPATPPAGGTPPSGGKPPENKETSETKGG